MLKNSAITIEVFAEKCNICIHGPWIASEYAETHQKLLPTEEKEEKLDLCDIIVLDSPISQFQCT